MVSEAGVPLPLVVLGSAAVPTLLGVCAYTVWVRERPTAPLYGVLIAALTAVIVGSLAPDLTPLRRVGVSAVAALLGTVAGALVPVLWVVYAMAYTGRGESLTNRRLLALCSPMVAAGVILVGVALFSNPQESSNLLLAGVFLVVAAYLVALLAAGVYFLGKLVTTYDHVPVSQVATQTFGVVAPYLVVSLSNVTSGEDGPRLLGFEAVYLVSALAAVAVVVATYRYPVTTVVPEAEHVTRDEVVETLREGVMVLDRDGRVLDTNETATELLDCTTEAAVGQSVDALVDAEIPAPGAPTRRVDVQTDAGVRQLEITVTEIGDEGSVGQTVVMRDVTERETRKQRLTVLNRVLRHNIRNDVDVIVANAEAVEDSERAETIQSLATDLARVSEKARDVERFLDTDRGPLERQNVTAVATTVADRVGGDYPDSEISVTTPGEITAETDEQVVRRILTELVENAVEHSDREEPRVELGVTAADDTVEITVTDDGPGIPERERRVLVEGDESPLRHGSGIGLWLVNWGVTYLGGSVSFADADPRGSVVTLSLPTEMGG